MGKNSWKKYLKNAKQEYNKIRSVECPAFENESVSFNREGFNHLLRKGSSIRSHFEKKQRLALLPFAVNILKESNAWFEERKTITNSPADGTISTAYFWSFKRNHNGKKITVVVRQINSGKKHFFSIMSKKAKTP